MHNLAQKLADITIPVGGDDGVRIPINPADGDALNTGLQMIFAIAGAVAVLIIAISAFRIIISRGNAQDVSKARDAIIYASIGLVVTLIAFAIVSFVVENL